MLNSFFKFILCLILLFLLCTSFTIHGQELQTAYEKSQLNTFSTHDEKVEYLYKLNSTTPDMLLDTYGKTREGRDLIYAVFSKSNISSAAEAHATGKPIVVLGAGVHGHNYVLREGLLILARELGTPGTSMNQLLDNVIVIMVPSINPDALELGSRLNKLGADLNRDYILLEQPAMAAYIGNLINTWHPHIMVDGHDGGAVQYGGAYPYNLLYQATATSAADLSITRLADEKVFPYLNQKMAQKEYKIFYWARGDEERYYGGGNAPRMGRNYGGLANILTILFEHADWHDAETALLSGKTALKTIIEYAAENDKEVINTIEEARNETIRLGKQAEGTIPVQEEMTADDFRVTYEIHDPENDNETITVENAEIIKKPSGTKFRDRPWAYVLPPQASQAVEMITRHNIRVEKITETVNVESIIYTIGDLNYENTDNNHRSALLIDVHAEVKDRFEIPEGSTLIHTGQLLGRVVTQLLEPENSDNIFYWNQMTPLVPIADFKLYKNDPENHDTPALPMWKIMQPKEIPSISK